MDLLLLAAALLIYSLWVITVGGSRSLLGFGTETDFIGGFVPEAKRFLAGAPLESSFHPPLYSMLLAWTYQLVGEWTQAGFLLSQISGAIALIATFVLFNLLFSSRYGAGAVAGMLAAPVFMTYSLHATSDVPFLAILLTSAAAAVAACRFNSVPLAIAAGLLIGLAVFLRSNGVALLLFMLLPLAMNWDWSRRLTVSLAAVAGVLFVAGIMTLFAAATGSSLFPTGLVDNLAMTFYAGDERITNEALETVGGRFNSVVEVLLYDPARVAKVFAADLARLLVWLPGALASPLSFVVVPGIVWLLIGRLDRLGAAALVCFAAHLALLNLKAFEARFFLLMIPFLGAGLAACAELLLLASTGLRRQAVMTVAALMLIAGIAHAGLKSANAVESYAQETKRIVEAGLPEMIPEGSIVVARKPHLAFYAEAEGMMFPDVDNWDALRAALLKRTGGGEMFLYFGEVEAARRPALDRLLIADAAPDWLIPVASSDPVGSWVLYRVKSEREP